MNIIYAENNMYHNSIDIHTSASYMLRIDCSKAEEGLKTTPSSQCAAAISTEHEPDNCSSMFPITDSGSFP